MYKSVRSAKNNVSLQHEEELENYLSYLSEYGWKTINLHGKTPDGIAVKNNIVVAVEILGCSKKNGCYTKPTNMIRQKYDDYSMFDHVLVKTFYRKPYGHRVKKQRIDFEELQQWFHDKYSHGRESPMGDSSNKQ